MIACVGLQVHHWCFYWSPFSFFCDRCGCIVLLERCNQFFPIVNVKVVFYCISPWIQGKWAVIWAKRSLTLYNYFSPSFLFFRRSSRASLFPDDSIAASDRLSGRQSAVSVHGLIRGRGHAGFVVSGREDGGTWRHSGHLHREKHGAELLFNSQVMETRRCQSMCSISLYSRLRRFRLWVTFALEQSDIYTWK